VKFSIINIEPLSGSKAQVYSIKFEDKYASELTIFVHKFHDTHPQIIDEAIQRIKLIAQREGIQNSFFRRESSESHNVFRLLETKDIRLYCIKFGETLLLFGSGGIKKNKTKKLKENPYLENEVKKLQKVEDSINKRIKSGQLSITSVGFIGNLNNLEL
jgi:hypothetical protein